MKAIRVYFFLLAGIALAGIVWAILRPTTTNELDVAELSRLAARADVTWEDYAEGIKAALGATPVALWQGSPARARLVDGGIEVEFALSGAWSEFEFGMPILLRDPEGKVSAPKRYARSASGGVYFFTHNGPVTPLSVPWAEVRFPPNEERRIAFDAKGAWGNGAR